MGEARKSRYWILDDITYDWIGVAKALAHTGGESIVASEYEIGEAYNLVQALIRVNAEPTGSTGVAGVISALESGYLRRSDRVAILLTGVLRMRYSIVVRSFQ